MENMDILHSMKDALMKYETIDAPQIDDLMNRTEVRPPAGWDDANGKNGNSSSNDGGTPKAPTPVDEPRTPNPGNTMFEQFSGK
jgi:cell division protease FtsH